MFKIKRKRKKLTRAEALRLSKGKYWIMGLEADEFVLVSLGVELGPKKLDEKGRIKRAKGLVVWGQCTIPDTSALTPYSKAFLWGPDCPDHIVKDQVHKRGHTVAELDWDDELFRKKVGADEEPKET